MEAAAADYWLVASPLDSNSREMLDELRAKLDPGLVSMGEKRHALGSVTVPEFKARAACWRYCSPHAGQTATLSQLLSLSELLAKQDAVFLSILSKIADQIRSLDSAAYSDNIRMDDGRTLGEYIMGAWTWDSSKYRAENRPLPDLIDSFVKVALAACP
jgi:hypothetical protein